MPPRTFARNNPATTNIKIIASPMIATRRVVGGGSGSGSGGCQRSGFLMCIFYTTGLFSLPNGHIQHVAPFVNQMSRKAWCLRHGLRTLKIRNWRECVQKSKDSGDSMFLTLGVALPQGEMPQCGRIAQIPSIKRC